MASHKQPLDDSGVTNHAQGSNKTWVSDSQGGADLSCLAAAFASMPADAVDTTGLHGLALLFDLASFQDPANDHDLAQLQLAVADSILVSGALSISQPLKYRFVDSRVAARVLDSTLEEVCKRLSGTAQADPATGFRAPN